jgi:hypothetical protein
MKRPISTLPAWHGTWLSDPPRPRRRRWHTALTLVLGLAACAGDDASRDGPDAALPDAGGDGPDGALPDAGGADPHGYEEPEACYELEEDSLSLALTWMRDDQPAVCTDREGLPDAMFTWTAPARGRYAVTAGGGSRLTADVDGFIPGETLRLETLPPPRFVARAVGCEGGAAPICSRTANQEDGSVERAVVALREGKPMTVVAQIDPDELPALDDDETYVAAVTIEPVVCDEVALGSATAVHFEDWVDGVGETIGPVSCVPSVDRAPTELGFHFVASEEGLYVATLTEEHGAPVALARFSTDCYEEIACVAATGEAEPRLELQLRQGEEVVLVGSAPNYPSEAHYLLLDIGRVQ